MGDQRPKWLITGADNAGWAIIMAKIEGGPMDGHATLFLADLPNPAIKIERTLDTIDSSFTGGHAVMSFTDLRLPADSVLCQRSPNSLTSPRSATDRMFYS